jgi:hypothetical protein
VYLSKLKETLFEALPNEIHEIENTKHLLHNNALLALKLKLAPRNKHQPLIQENFQENND